MFFLSARGTGPFRGSESFDVGTDSPVREASDTWSDEDSIILQSAGILVPSSTIRMSPGTRSSEEISRVFPSRMTFDFRLESFFKASIDFSALYSWMKPKTALKITIIRITIASTFSPARIAIIIAKRRM